MLSNLPKVPRREVLEPDFNPRLLPGRSLGSKPLCPLMETAAKDTPRPPPQERALSFEY